MWDELALAGLLLASAALVSCLSVTDRRAIRRLPRGVWVAVILLVPVIGATAWFLYGRPVSLHVARVVVGRRRVSSATVRQALTVALLGIALVVTATISLLMITDETLDRVLFEAVSAFATVGLSTGITADLPAVGQLILMILMFVGRVGTITVASALALRTSHRQFRYPEERPIVG